MFFNTFLNIFLIMYNMVFNEVMKSVFCNFNQISNERQKPKSLGWYLRISILNPLLMLKYISKMGENYIGTLIVNLKDVRESVEYINGSKVGRVRSAIVKQQKWVRNMHNVSKPLLKGIDTDFPKWLFK